MAWIELHDTLPDHDKVLEVSEALKMDKDLVVGKLVRLWTWALNNREDGIFKARDIQTIAEVMRYKGRAQRLVDALAEARLLDRDGEIYSIHDWDERVGMLLAKRETSRSQARDRKRKQREKGRDNVDSHDDVTRDKCDSHAVTVPKPYSNQDTPPYIPPANTFARFDEFWRGYPRKINKANAQKAWGKLKPDDALVDKMMKAVAEQKKSVLWTKDGERFIPHAATWLNGQRWEDEVGKPPPKRRTSAHNHSTRQYTDAELANIGVDLLEDV